MVPPRWRLVVNIAHSESKDVMTKAQSFLSTEESENHLGLSTLTRKGAVHGVSSSSHHNVSKDCLRVTESVGF